MVKIQSVLRRAAILLAATLVASATAAHARELAGYKIGDRVEENIVTPIPLVVVDPEATAILKEREGERVPAVFRFDPDIADSAIAAFHESFITTRGNFLDAVERAFNRRKLDAASLASQEFADTVAAFQRRNRLFPMSAELARVWASGESDEAMEQPLTTALRNVMKQFVRSTNTVSAAAKIGSTAHVVWCRESETLTELMVSRHGTNYPKADFISFQRARTDLEDSFPEDQHAVASFLRSFIQPNAFVEDEMTIRLREKRTEGMTSTDAYSAGQVIAKRGQIVDAKIFAAITALNKQLAPPPAAATATPVPSARNSNQLWWIAGIATAVLLVGAALGTWARRRVAASLMPARTDSRPMPPAASATEREWQQRALEAERRAEKAQAVIRKGLIAHLAGWMSDTLVQRLLLQRAQLLDAQEKAVTQVNRLGERLDTIQTRMQSRLLAYEKRIAELEKELDTKDEINRELIQAEIDTIRRQMDAERAKSEGGLN